MQKDREAEVCKGVLVEEEDWPWHRGLSIGSREGVNVMFVSLVGFLTSSPTTRLYRRPALRQSI